MLSKFGCWSKKNYFKFVGWINTKPLNSCMSETPCGCEIEKKARITAKDEDGLLSLLESAKQEQQKWGCPCAGFKEPKEFSEEQMKTLHQIQVLTGIHLKDENGEYIFKTCPNYSFSNTTSLGIDISFAATARKYRDKGQLQIIESDPTYSLIEAMEYLDEGFNNAQSRLYEIEKEEAEARNKRALSQYMKASG